MSNIIHKIVIKKAVLYAVAVAIGVWGAGVNCHAVSDSGEMEWAAGYESKLDILFVIDNSGSMQENDPEFITREVVMNFLGGLPDNSRLGMVIFDQDARLIEPLAERRGPETAAAFIESLKNVDYTGQFTNSPAGIERAVYELKTNGRNEAERLIIFLTDGIVDTGNRIQDIEKERWLREDVAEESRKAGIRIFGIGFSEKADYYLIQALARKTDGEYFRAYTAADIPAIFTKINELISKPSAKTVVSYLPLPEADVLAPADTTVKPSASLPTRQPLPPEHDSSSWKNSLSFFAVAVGVLGLGIMIFLRFFKRKTPGTEEENGEENEKENENEEENADDHVSGRSFPPPDEPMPDAKLIDVKGVSSVGSLPFLLNKRRVSIGRDSGNDVVVDSKTVSSLHATIEYSGGLFYLEDHRSTNGTFLNEKRIDQNRPLILKSGDRIRFAGDEFRFLMPDQDPVGKTIMLESSSLSTDINEVLETKTDEVDDFILFKECFSKHLKRISALGSACESFVNQYVNSEIVDVLAERAREIMSRTQVDYDEHDSVMANSPVLYRLCTLPVKIEDASAWFASKHDGYVKFLNKSLKSEYFTTSECTILCLVSYGRIENPWVSVTVVSTKDDSEGIDIMSVEFLSEEEKRLLSLEFGELGRIL